MKLYNLFLPEVIREQIREHKDAAGFKTEAGFIRAILPRSFPIDGKVWTDQDLIDFARDFTHRKPNSPAVLESEDVQLKKALDKFKQSK